jgi:hypothetical protein
VLNLVSLNVYCQWTTKVIDNGFDEPFKKAYTETKNNGWLAMEEGEYEVEISYTKPLLKTKESLTFPEIKNDKLYCLGFDELSLYEDSTLNKLKYLSKGVFYIIDSYTYKLQSGESKAFLVWNPSSNEIGWTWYKNLANTTFNSQSINSNRGVKFLSDCKNDSEYYLKLNDSIIKINNQIRIYNDSIQLVNDKIKNENKVETKIKYPLFYLQGNYFCDDYIDVDLVLLTNGIREKYTVAASKSKDSKSLYFEDEIFKNPMFVKNFKNATKISIRVNESHCEDGYYEFNMGGSTKALDFIMN